MPFPLYLCVHLRDFAAQALTRPHTSVPASRTAVAVLSGDPPLERVFAMNQQARDLGVQTGMSRVQAESFPLALLRRNREQEEQSFAELMNCAQQFSPRVQAIASPQSGSPQIASPQKETSAATLVLDVSGSERLLGSAHQSATTLQQFVNALGYETSVASAHNAYAAVLAARGFPGITTIELRREAETLSPLPLSVLELDDAHSQTFAAWGIQTLGQLAALPAKSLAARLGASGLRLRALARGEYDHLLVPIEDPADAVLSESMELEHPVELLEPLLFLLSQMLEQILQRAAQRALAIASVDTCLVLEDALDKAVHGESEDESSERKSKGTLRQQHRRTVRPALPERDRHTLLKLIQLDLELHPPEAAVIALHIEAHPARSQTAQQGLFDAQAPEVGRMEILLARLRKLVGEGRVGTPELLDSHEPESFRITNFNLAYDPKPAQVSSQPDSNQLMQSRASALRMVRPPRAIAIELCGDKPAAMHYEGRRLMLQASSGPWRTSGAWWTHPSWCREEWDVVLKEQPQRCLRLAHDPSASCWYVIGIYD